RPRGQGRRRAQQGGRGQAAEAHEEVITAGFRLGPGPAARLPSLTDLLDGLRHPVRKRVAGDASFLPEELELRVRGPHAGNMRTQSTPWRRIPASSPSEQP